VWINPQFGGEVNTEVWDNPHFVESSAAAREKVMRCAGPTSLTVQRRVKAIGATVVGR
jgi:tRNA U34 5-methylaminomethyl-2-thiouridine-forming methyltransferase MnmC